MKKKLVLNKQIIANLNNPDKIFGGADTWSNLGTCEGYTCNYSCAGCPPTGEQDTCPIVCDSNNEWETKGC